MIVALVYGAGVGAGLLAVATGLRPTRPSLADSLAALRQVPAPPPLVAPTGTDSALVRLGRPLAAPLGARKLIPGGVRADLAVIGRDPQAHLAEKTALAVIGLVLGPATAGLLALDGAHLGWAVPAWAAIVLAIGGFFAPDLALRSQATRRRADFRHALSAFLDLVVIALAAGGGVDSALSDAAQVGAGESFAALRRALEAARLARVAPWGPLGRLGDELGITELSELAASVSLAGSEGAKVRESLAAKAASLRAHALADAEGEAQAATEAMSLPVVLLFAGFLVFLAFPALAHVFGTL
ncbi:MAG: type II secretion system F family protein [Acidimicrobiales bacterium]